MKDELYKRYRPKTLSDVVGQRGAVESIQTMLDNDDVPHAVLFSGVAVGNLRWHVFSQKVSGVPSMISLK